MAVSLSRTPNSNPTWVWVAAAFLTEGSSNLSPLMAIDQLDQLYIVDMMGRIQVFDIDGNYVRGCASRSSHKASLPA